MDAWKQRQAVQLGQNIRDRRKELGITQSALAEGLFSTQSVSLIERGKLNVTQETLEIFAQRLQCDVADLVRFHDPHDELLDELLQTALQYKEKHQHPEALGTLHALYTEALAKNSEKYLRESAYHLCLIYHLTGKQTISNDWGQEALKRLDPAHHLDLTINTYSTMGRNYYQLGKLWDAYDLFREGEKLIEQYNYPQEQAGLIFYTIAIMKHSLRNWEGCIWYCERALKIFEEHDSIIKIGGTHMMLGNSYTEQQRYDKARQHYERSIRILSQTSDQLSLGRAYHNFGGLDMETGQHESARKNYLKSLKLKRQAKDVTTIPSTLRSLADLAIREQKFEEGRQYLQEAMRSAEPLKSSLQMAQTMKLLGELELKEGNDVEFVRLYQNAIDYFEKLKFSSGLAEACDKLGEYYITNGQAQLAVPYLQQAAEHYRKLWKRS